MPEEYTITITSAEADIIGKGLGELPLKEGVNIFLKLKAQIIQQQLQASQAQAIKDAAGTPADAAPAE